MMDEAGVEALRENVKKVHGCDAQWVESVPVQETYFSGEVQLFALTGHPTATQCYAWSQMAGRERRIFAVLRGATVNSGAQAVRATIAARERTQLF